MNSDIRSQISLQIALAIGFVSVGIGVLIASANPATGYELSIYESTPLGFWVAVTIGAVLSLIVAGSRRAERWIRGSAIILAIGSIMSIVTLPLIRNYYYYGSGDSMSHLGWAREVGGGVLSPLGLLYPGIHITANYMSEVAGIELTQTLQLIPMVIYPLLGVLTIALCVNYLTDSQWGFIVGLFSGLLFIPINKLSVHIIAHPSSQAILFFSLVLYLLFRFLTQPGDARYTSVSSVALAIVAVAMIFIHPQESMMMLVTLITVTGVQLVYRRKQSESVITQQPLVLGHALLTGVIFTLWLPQHTRAVDRLLFVIGGFLEQGTETGTEVTTRTASLTALGGSVEELFVKLFLPTLIIGLLAGVLLIANLTGRLQDNKSNRNSLITYITAALFPLTGAVVVIFLAQQGDHYFRFFGLLMVPVTIVGGVAIAELLASIDRRTKWPAATTVFVSIFIFLLAMQMLTIHASPYMYQSNKQVTQAEMTGYEFAFEHRTEETPMLALRIGPRRFVDAYYGRYTARAGLDFPGYRGGVHENEFNRGLSGEYDGDRYFATRSANQQIEVGLYNELRYTQDGFDQLERDRSIHRVQDNGDFRLYLVRDN